MPPRRRHGQPRPGRPKAVSQVEDIRSAREALRAGTVVGTEYVKTHNRLSKLILEIVLVSGSRPHHHRFWPHSWTSHEWRPHASLNLGCATSASHLADLDLAFSDDELLGTLTQLAPGL